MSKKILLEEIVREALKYETRTEFNRKGRRYYEAAWRMGVLDQVCAHMPKHVDMSGENSPTFKWTFEKLQAEALKYNTKTEFKKNNLGAYMTALRRGILDKICKHMKTYFHSDWTEKELHEIALKCNSRYEFKRNCPGGYRAAIRMGILDKICAHMGARQNERYTLEEIQTEALKYTNRSDFFEKSKGAYCAAQSRGILDIVCAHMKPSRGSSRPELELLAIIRQKYPSAKKIRDLNVKIEGKPHAHWFELDIFIEELNLGFEFDGQYHHSPEYLAKHRRNWPLEDALNKAQIKDDWFMSSKGIKILHVNGKDWSKDKQVCIKKCFDFIKQSQEIYGK